MFFSATVSSSWRAYPACLTAWSTNLRPTRCFERPCKDSSAAFGFGMTSSRVCYRATTHKVARVLQSHREMLDVSLCLCGELILASVSGVPHSVEHSFKNDSPLLVIMQKILRRARMRVGRCLRLCWRLPRQKTPRPGRRGRLPLRVLVARLRNDKFAGVLQSHNSQGRQGATESPRNA
jgi:hypothetical protein